MAPWPELENAQPTSEKHTVKADGDQSAKPEKGKETEKGKCPPPALGWPPLGRPQETQAWFLIPHGLSLLVWADDTGAPITKIELVPSHSTAALIEEPTEVEDPWDLPELKDTGIKWSGK